MVEERTIASSRASASLAASSSPSRATTPRLVQRPPRTVLREREGRFPPAPHQVRSARCLTYNPHFGTLAPISKTAGLLIMVEVSNSHSAVFDRTCELSCWSPPSNPETSSSDKMDPVLELWIDDNAVPIKVRLAGLLDADTGAAVRSVIGELLAEGHRDFALEIDGLEQPDAVWVFLPRCHPTPDQVCRGIAALVPGAVCLRLGDRVAAFSSGVCRQLPTVAQSDLGEEGRHVVLHFLLRRVHPRADLTVREPFSDVIGYDQRSSGSAAPARLAGRPCSPKSSEKCTDLLLAMGRRATWNSRGPQSGGSAPIAQAGGKRPLTATR